MIPRPVFLGVLGRGQHQFGLAISNTAPAKSAKRPTNNCQLRTDEQRCTAR